jgi:hypothetical protein
MKQAVLLFATVVVLVSIGFSAAIAQTACSGEFGLMPCVFLPNVEKAPDPTEVPPTPVPTPVPTAQPQIIFVGSSTALYEFGSYVVVGEVINNSGGNAFFTQIEVKAFDLEDKLVAAETGFAFLERIGDGQKSPFRISITNAPVSIVRRELKISYRTSSIFQRIDAEIISQQVRDNSGVEVFGELKNGGQKILSGVKVVVTFYHENGRVVFADTSYTSLSRIAPGESATYSIKTFRQNLTYARYVVVAQGDAIDP